MKAYLSSLWRQSFYQAEEFKKPTATFDVLSIRILRSFLVRLHSHPEAGTGHICSIQEPF